jgi:hypothetical protein
VVEKLAAIREDMINDNAKTETYLSIDELLLLPMRSVVQCAGILLEVYKEVVKRTDSSWTR